MALAGISAIYPQKSLAEGLTGDVFQDWSIEGQDSYIQTSVTMAGIVFTQTHPGHAACINTTYFGGNLWDARRAEFRDTITKFPAAHPGGVILAMILKECGPLD